MDSQHVAEQRESSSILVFGQKVDGADLTFDFKDHDFLMTDHLLQRPPCSSFSDRESGRCSSVQTRLWAVMPHRFCEFQVFACTWYQAVVRGFSAAQCNDFCVEDHV